METEAPRGSVAPDTGELLDIVGAIYDTVLDRTIWPDVLRRLSLFVQGASSAVFWEDAANTEGDVYFHDGGIPAYYKDLYFSKYVKLNPITIPRFFTNVEEPIATADLIPYDEFLQTRFYREWAEPQGLIDFISISLEKSSGKAAMFGVFRHIRNGVVDEATRARMRLLAPHIRRAVLISKVIDFKRDEAEMFSNTLDRLRAAVILVDAGGRIVHANAAAHVLFSQGDVIRAVNGALAASAGQADQRLRGVLLAAAKGDAAIGGEGIALPLMGKTGDRYVAHALPLTSRARRQTGRTYRAVVAIFIHKASLESASPPAAIAEAYGLTMAELRVLFAIVDIGGVPEVAEVLGIAASTVKTHLGRVYEKTGAARQADLVKLVAGFSSSLVS
ncbi:MAG TPA: LuxR C-terminal-related transcriptional regulator [Roseiarcus sp.]|jgi:DNA-binding CsgD family transcriptional regulator/PAS domain-containing protein|nr:LuxR C-terminal-related transcriptional regulator [Roseiarcus sp.]